MTEASERVARVGWVLLLGLTLAGAGLRVYLNAGRRAVVQAFGPVGG